MNHHLDQEVVAGFISEAKGYLPEIMLGLESFATDATQQHGLREAFRFAHIIKGAASMLGFMQISEVAYQLEVTLEMLCEKHLPLSQELLEELCQNISDLADLLDQLFVNAPTESASEISADAPVLEDLSINELPTENLSTNELSITELSIPELLAPDATETTSADASDQVISLEELPMPELSVTPTDYEEKGETILLSSTETDDDLLPEAKASMATLTAAQLEELATEEPLVSLLDEASYSVSLPKITDTPTIGDVDLNEVAKELKETYGDYPSLPQPEFAIPEELMAGLPELRFTSDLDEPTAEALPMDLPAEDIQTDSASATEVALAEALPESQPEALAETQIDEQPETLAETQIEEQAEILPEVSSEAVEFSEPANTVDLAIDHLTDEVVQDVMEASTPTIEEDAALPEPEAVAEAADVTETMVEESVTEMMAEEVVTETQIENAFADAQPEEVASEAQPEEFIAETTTEEEFVAEEQTEEAAIEPVVDEFIAEAQTEEAVAEPVTEEVVDESVAEEFVTETIFEEFIAETQSETVVIEPEAETVVTETVAEEAFPAPSFPEEIVSTTITEDALPEPTFEENWTSPVPDFQSDFQNDFAQPASDFETAEIPAPTFDEAVPDVLPDALAMPSLPELSEPTYFDQQFDPPTAEQMPEEIFDAAMTMPTTSESVSESEADSAPDVSTPLSMSSPAISDEMAQELMETFLLEAEEHLQNLHTSLRVLYKNPNNRELIQEVRRSSHSLKGTAAMVGLDNIMQLAHRMEDVLDLIYDGKMELTQDRTLLLMQATDTLEDMSNGQSNASEVQRIYGEFARLLSSSSSTETLETTVQEAAPTVEEVVINTDEPILEINTSIEPESVTSPEDAVLEIVETTPAQTVTEFTFDTEAESLLPALSMELPVVETPTEQTGEAELQIPELSFENFAKVVKEPVVEVTSEASVPMVAEPVVEHTPFVAPATATETISAPAPKAQSTLASPAETKTTTVQEPEVLPAAPAGAMTQASSQFVRVPIERLDDVVKLISEMIITRTMFEQRLVDFARQVEELQITGTRLRRASSNLESKYEASTLGGGRSVVIPNNMPSKLSATAALAATGLVNSLVTHNTHGFDDLEFDRYTEFHLVSRELVESSTDIQTLGRELNHLNTDFLSYLNRQGRIYSELQDRLMRLRMVPLSSIAPRLHRTVRTVSVQQQKEVELILEGETTAVDTTALMEMTDPLLHLLRNAVDHGIESPEARVAKGKPAQGKIVMRAFYEGSQVVLQLRDDGQGLNADKIRNRAIRHGMISAAEAETMSLNELWSLIFTPGFSTADQISEISGRGVGMDVVHTTIQKLKGTITIDSQQNVGTVFTIRLPLTLAVTRSLMVKGSGQTFAIPLDVVTQIMRLEMNKVERIGQEPVIRLGGKVYPLLMLSRLLNLRQTTDEISPRPPALLLSVEGKEVVVIVDQLMGGREIVIKTLGNHLKKIHGVMGATLMGDGEVVLILNLAELLRGTVRVMPRRLAVNTAVASSAAVETAEASQSAMSAEPVAPAATQPVAPAIAPPKPKTANQTLTIMIVDDSPSVRRVSSNMIKNIGWLPVLAKDGLDALEQLQASETPPDLILLDIEMPRMDGYQFLGSVRSLPAYRNLPVVIVSSRSSEKHRQKAFDLGATEYLVKPYQEDNVISLICRLVQEGHQ